jgi:DNA polymerase III delta prime subunit
MLLSADEYLWCEKYRPRRIADCVLPQSIQETFDAMIREGQVQNLLLCGGPGVGKTTVAKALCDEMGCDWILINCSEDGNIDTLRTRIREFASSVSFSGGNKVVILDEFDYSNPQSMQPALRGFMEEFSKNCRFILTCNYKNRIIQPLHSRCTVIDFRIPAAEKPIMAKRMHKRICSILEAEDIEYDNKVVAELVMRRFPDFRRTINDLQKYALGGKVDVGILGTTSSEKVNDLIGFMKKREFGNIRKWVASNIDNDHVGMFRSIYDCIYDVLEPQSIPQAILTLADYQYKAAFAADQEINTMACISELMVSCEFKK